MARNQIFSRGGSHGSRSHLSVVAGWERTMLEVHHSYRLVAVVAEFVPIAMHIVDGIVHSDASADCRDGDRY